MNFKESEKYLLSLGNEVLAMKLGLENISKLLRALGNLQNKYLKVQIAGTNGKGSTVAFLEAICVAAGIKVGATTSPHLVSITERVRIDGAEISEDDFAGYATLVRATAEKLVETGELETVPTYFEQVTAIALTAFAEAKIELAILETGLGGRYDATTAARAELVAITPIDYDHQNILGNSLAEIAAEKAAIIREDTQVVIGEQKEEALKIILERCREKNIVPVFDNCQIIEEDSPEVSFKTKKDIYPVVILSLEGEHQRQNACVAINLAENLKANFNLGIPASAIIKGLESAKHKGRLEWINRYGGNGSKILFDGAHNIAGASVLRNYVEKYTYNRGGITMIFGAMKDKDLTEIAEILFPLAEDLILTEPDNPRSMKVEDLKEYAEKVVNQSKIFLVPNVADAIDSAMQINSTYTKTKNAFVCITGSLYLVGEAQAILRKS